MRLGNIGSRCVSVAVNNKPCVLDLLHLTYPQKSIIRSGGHAPEDAYDVHAIMTSGRWDLERIITHEFALDHLEAAIRTAGDVEDAHPPLFFGC